MPEFVKHFIVANPTVLMTLLMGLALLGCASAVRWVRIGMSMGSDEVDAPQNRRIDRSPDGLQDEMASLNRRLEHLEALTEFDQQLSRTGSQVGAGLRVGLRE